MNAPTTGTMNPAIPFRGNLFIVCFDGEKIPRSKTITPPALGGIYED